MVTNSQFIAARQSRIYLQPEPIIAAAKRGIRNPDAFGFKKVYLSAEDRTYESNLYSKISRQLILLNSTSSDQIRVKDLRDFSDMIAISLVYLKPDSLLDLARRGILSPECAVALSNSQMIPIDSIARASFDMILEYRAAGFDKYDCQPMVRRFLPLSYLYWMEKIYDVPRWEIIYHIDINTFPHIELSKVNKHRKSRKI